MTEHRRQGWWLVAQTTAWTGFNILSAAGADGSLALFFVAMAGATASMGAFVLWRLIKGEA